MATPLALPRHDAAARRSKGPARERSTLPSTSGARFRPPHPNRAMLAAMDQLDLARIQFATTSVYHFLFVP
jgi:hypothetical protein